LHNIDTETRLHSGRLGVRITTGHINFSLFQIIQKVSWVSPGSHSMNTRALSRM